MKISTERLKQLIREEVEKESINKEVLQKENIDEEENEATLALGLLSKLRIEMGETNEMGVVAGGTFDQLQNLLQQIERSLYYLRKDT
jgi:hypothetical protein